MPSKNSGKCNILLNWDHLSWGAYFIDVNKWDFGPLHYQCFDFIEILCHFKNNSILLPESLVMMYRIVSVRLLENYQKSILGKKCMLIMIFDSYIYIKIYTYRYTHIYRYAYWWLSVKESTSNARNIGNTGSLLGLRLPPGEGNGNPLQDSCLANPMDTGAWRAIVQRVAKSWTREQHSTCIPAFTYETHCSMCCYCFLSSSLFLCQYFQVRIQPSQYNYIIVANKQCF